MKYSEFAGKHEGSKVVVCGCGTSLTSFLPYREKFVTIGVNDVGRLFQPDYLVVLNTPGSFKSDRWKYVEETKAKNVFTQYDAEKVKGVGVEKIVKIELKKGDLNDTETVDHSNNSPYVGTVIAYHMGARVIGIVGLDFTEDHFFDETGRHPLTGSLKMIDEDYERLVEKLSKNGTELFNLSGESLVTSIPKITVEEFLKM